MIDIKSGTQTWSDAKVGARLAESRDQRMSAEEKEKFFGGKDVGDVLNEIADPNWIDPTKKIRTTGNNQLDKDAFLTLLLTQMKNQDPTNPLQSHEMAAQLAQFTSLEKLTNINDGIDKLTQAHAPNQNLEALQFIGKAVVSDSSKILRTDPQGGHQVSFRVDGSPASGSIAIKNQAGEVVRELTLSGLKSGDNQVYWNGQSSDGLDLPAGEYRAEITIKAGDGKKLHAETQKKGEITGVNFTSQGPVLLIGDKKLSLKEVTEIMAVSNNKNLSAIANEVETKDSENASNKGVQGATSDDLKSVGMSQGLINELQKSGAKVGM